MVEKGSLVTTDGEIIEKGQYSPIDSKPFIKMYKEAVPHLSKLNHIGWKVLCLILSDLNRLETEVLINARSYSKLLGYSNTRDVYNGVKELLEINILARKTEKDMYFINIGYIFNGDRTKLNNGL